MIQYLNVVTPGFRIEAIARMIPHSIKGIEC